MSNTLLRRARALRHYPKTGKPIKAGPKFILCLLADTSRDGVRAWPSVATLAADSGASRRAVQNALHDLEAGGVISGKRMDGKATEWTLHLPEAGTEAPGPGINGRHYTPPESAPPERQDAPRAETAPRAESAPQGVQNPTCTRAESAPKPLLTQTLTQRVPPTPRRRGEESGFAEFFNLYPKQVARGRARRAWRAALRAGADPEAILGGLEGALDLGEFDMRQAGRFCPSPAAWLRAERWTDGQGIDEEAPPAPLPPAHLAAAASSGGEGVRA